MEQGRERLLSIILSPFSLLQIADTGEGSHSTTLKGGSGLATSLLTGSQSLDQIQVRTSTKYRQDGSTALKAMSPAQPSLRPQ